MVDLVRDKLDFKKSNDGVWVKIRDFGEVKIRRWNNPEYRKTALVLREAKLEELGKDPDFILSEEESYDIMVKAACQDVILDWKGIESDGQPVPYSQELASSTFLDPDEAWKDQFYDIVAAANERAKFVRERREANAKKL